MTSYLYCGTSSINSKMVPGGVQRGQYGGRGLVARRPPLFAPIIPTLRLRPILSIHGAVTLNTLSLQLQFYEQSWHSDDRLQACLPAACLARLIRMPAPAPARTRSTRYSSLRRPTMKHLLCQDPAPSNALAPPLLSAALEPDPVRQSWRCKSPDASSVTSVGDKQASLSLGFTLTTVMSTVLTLLRPSIRASPSSVHPTLSDARHPHRDCDPPHGARCCFCYLCRIFPARLCRHKHRGRCGRCVERRRYLKSRPGSQRMDALR